MLAEQWHKGRAAAPGFATGPLFRLSLAGTARNRLKGSSEDEANALRAAIAAAIADIALLQANAAEEAAEILEFQVAMLSDDALAERAFAEIAAGKAADLAWQQTMDAQIHDYSTAEDEYFRARAADMTDMRDCVLRTLLGVTDMAPPPGAVVLCQDLSPTRFLAWDWSHGGGIALTGGSPSSHVAMLARARGVPMVVGLPLPTDQVYDAVSVLLDGEAGCIRLNPSESEIVAFQERRALAEAVAAQWQSYLHKPAVTALGERVLTQINVAEPEELARLDPTICDGIGLVRTEFLFHGQQGLPDEDRQYAVYRRILNWADGRPVTIRTLDAGGDKPIAGLTEDGESNPFLGLRGIRLSLAHPEIFRVQLRALLRAAVTGRLKVMLPMVTVPEEVIAVAELMKTEMAMLERSGIACRLPELGIMIEVPAAALTVDRFPAAFYSIGSNDLTQYVTAAARDINAVAGLNDSTNPAVLQLIERVARFGYDSGREVSLCGDAGGDPRMIPLLLACGLRNFSMAPAMLARAKATIAQWQGGSAK